MPVLNCPSREELSGYLVGKLPAGEWKAVAAHIEECGECQSELGALNDADDTLVGTLRQPTTPDPFLAEPECATALARAKACATGFQPVNDRPRSIPTADLGEYRLLDELGHGAMGSVCRALHQKLDRVVAVKILPRGRMEDPRAIARFEREMRAIGRLDHANIVRAYDAREIDGRPVLVMEYVEGLDLGRLARRVSPLDVADACELARQAAIGLQYVHEHGLVHRDIKPSNLMVTPQGQVKVLDLGLARFHAEQPAEDDMTGVGQAMGTADYMAPEQTSDSRTVDIRADIYSLGCTLYKLLAGRAPFSGPRHKGTFEKMTAHVQETPPPVSEFNPAVPKGLVAVVDRMLAKDPESRYATPGEVAQSLATFCAGADLPALVARAVATVESSSAGDDWSHRPPTNDSRAASAAVLASRWRIPVTLLVGLALLGGGFALGILIRIQKDGRETTLDVPEGSHVQIGPDGRASVRLPGEGNGSGGSSAVPVDVGGEVPESEKKILAVLDQPTEFAFVDRPLHELIREVAKRHGIEIQVDSYALGNADIDISTPVTRKVKGVSLSSALRLVLRDLDLSAVVKDEVLLITTSSVAESFSVTKIYLVGDLVRQPGKSDAQEGEYDALVALIQKCVATDSWNGNGGQGTIGPLENRDMLVISQTEENHRAIARLLAELRRPGDGMLASEKRILAALDSPTELTFFDSPLNEIVDALKQRHGIEIQFDLAAVSSQGIPLDAAITRVLSGTTLRSALNLLLRDFALAWAVKDEVLWITTPEVASSPDFLIVRAYAVGDLADSCGDRKYDCDYGPLIALIQNNVAAHTWLENGGSGAISPWKDRQFLVILQTEENHREVMRVLAELRREGRTTATDVGRGDRLRQVQSK